MHSQLLLELLYLGFELLIFHKQGSITLPQSLVLVLHVFDFLVVRSFLKSVKVFSQVFVLLLEYPHVLHFHLEALVLAISLHVLALL